MKQALKGNIIHTPLFGAYTIIPQGFIVYDMGSVLGVYHEIPPEHRDASVTDYGDRLIIPGFVDLHLHAPQFANRGLGLDKELLPWLETYAFPEESKFGDLMFAEKAYRNFVKALWTHGTTRSVVFATIHREAAELLMTLMAQAGLGGYVGKVNMDRNCPEYYIESTQCSLDETERFIRETNGRHSLVKPIITPRFVPSCTSELMAGLGALSAKYNVPVQSHLSENTGENAWVKELHPDMADYAGVYNAYGLFGQQKTVMAHCVHVTEDEIALMAKNKVYAAHSPHSNNNLGSGISPVRQMLEAGVPVGLASDVSGSHEIAMQRVITVAAQVSKLKWLESGKRYAPLSTPELVYMATKGGGSFFGKVGSFEEGYEMDALVIDDSSLADVNQRSLEERLQRYLYCGDDRNIRERYVRGTRLEEPGL